MTPKIPKVVIKSLFTFMQENKNTNAVSAWLVKSQGLDQKTAEFVAGKIKGAKDTAELEAFLNGSDDEPVKMSAAEMQMMAGGRAAVSRASSTAATKSKWPWE